MEESRRYREFFFEDANQRLASLFQWIFVKFNDLYKGSKKRADKSIKKSFADIITRQKEQRFSYQASITGNDLGKLAELRKLGIYEYLLYIRKITKETKKA